MSGNVLISILDLLSETVPEPDQSIVNIVHKTAEILDCPSGFYAALDERAPTTVLQVLKNFPSAGSPETDSVKLLCFEILTRGGCSSQPVSLPLKSGSQVITGLEFQGFLAFPVFSGTGQPIGLIAGLDTRERQFTAAECTVLGCGARLIALEEIRLQREKELQSTISALIRNREADLRDLERKVLQHFGSLVAPAITRLKAGRLNATQRSWLDVLESNLRDMVLPTAACLATGACRLTPAEIRTADLVRRGHTAADIARRLNLSVRTVESHCYNIRKKLNLKNRRLNLKSFLQGSGS